MKRLTKIAAGILLGLGLPISLGMLIEVVNPQTNPKDRQGAFAALILFGLPPTALGGWLVVEGQRAYQRQERDRIRATFFRLVQAGQGQLNLLRFAMETGLDGDTAKTYLNERAREFNATFDVTDEGKLLYCFDLGGTHLEAEPKAMLEAEAEYYDVILESMPANRQRQAVHAVRQLTGCSWQQSKTLVKQLPTPVRIGQDLSRVQAEQYRQELEKVGARVLVVLK